MWTDRQIDLVAHALADATRRRIIRRLAREPGLTSGELATSVRQLSRWGVLKHVAALREAGLIETLSDGRRRRHYVNLALLEPVAAWIRETSAADTRETTSKR